VSESGNGGVRYCPHCGEAGTFGHRFCSKCGKDQSDPAVESHTPPQGVTSSSGYRPQAPVATPPLGNQRNRNRWRVGIVAFAAVVLLGGGAGAYFAFGNNKSISHPHSPPGNKSRGQLAYAVHAKTYSSFESEYASVKDAVVKIKTFGCDGNEYEGSGFAIDAHHIVTAAHVIESSESITVLVGGVPVPAHLIGLDVSGDVALLETSGALNAPFIPLENHNPAVGERVAAIGYPLGGSLTMTQGSVSALQQSITVNDTQLAGLVQTDTALNHGNSGGPLMSLDGRANGIVDALDTDANATGYATSPKYAGTDVANWISQPQNLPLPLCSSPDPLETISALPPTPTTAPTTPTDNEPGTAIPNIQLSSDGFAAMGVVQSLANALSSHQWDQARAIYPSLGSDSELAADYGALNASTVVITGETDSGAVVDLSGAFVAWETVAGVQRTSIYCISWNVNPQATEVQSESSIDSNLVAYQDQWTDPIDLVSVVASQCTP
jgi:hypothetical protein